MEKHELRSRLLESNRIVVKPATTDTGNLPHTSSSSSSTSLSLPSQPTLEDLQSLSFDQLKDMAKRHNLDTKGINEKSALVFAVTSALHHLPASTLAKCDLPVLTRNELDNLSMYDYLQLFTRLGLSTAGLLEKSDMCDILLQSHRVMLVD